MNNKNLKPPIGILPKKIYEMILKKDIAFNGGMYLNEIKKQRVADLKGAIIRYIEAVRYVDLDWIKEYNGLLSELGVKK